VGTVECILTPEDEFYFLEVNARLQWSTRSPK
jgi:biotin carboxylase